MNHPDTATKRERELFVWTHNKPISLTVQSCIVNFIKTLRRELPSYYRMPKIGCDLFGMLTNTE